MLPSELLDPKSILVVGGSTRLDHLGGSVLKNLLDQGYSGELLVMNPNRDLVQGVRSYRRVEDVPGAELAIFAIPAAQIRPIMETLIRSKGTRAFIVYSAGFSELNEEGRVMEQELLSLVNENGCSLLGPNHIGMLNQNYAGIFTKPVPRLDPKGVDYVSGSGATAVFTVEAAKRTGLTFNSLITVGNSAQIGIEEVLEHWDEAYVPGKSSRVKMLYLETVRNPRKFLKHAISLRSKGCSLVALKSGSTEKGSAAAASHTGAMASPDLFVQALLDRSGVIRCHSRYALVTIAGLLQLSEKTVRSFAVITHAGGPAVILTDHLEQNGLDVPTLNESHRAVLEALLNPGASVANPIDLLATGSAEQLDQVIEYCDREMDEVDGLVVIFGSPGLGSMKEAYEVIHQKAISCRKPLFPVLPSVVNLEQEIEEFTEKGHIAFFDESLLGRGLGKIASVRQPVMEEPRLDETLRAGIEELIATLPDGFLPADKSFELLDLLGIPVARPAMLPAGEVIDTAPNGLNYPLVVKATGILHKTEQNAVALNINTSRELEEACRRLGSIQGANGLMVQEMLTGTEVYIGSKRIPGYPPLVMFGAGGIFVEVLRDVKSVLGPVGPDYVWGLARELKSYKILEGTRGRAGIDMAAFANTVSILSALVNEIPRIAELDINPLMADPGGVTAVDVRIRLTTGS